MLIRKTGIFVEVYGGVQMSKPQENTGTLTTARMRKLFDQASKAAGDDLDTVVVDVDQLTKTISHQSRREVLEGMPKKSVAELENKFHPALNDIALKVSYKEGYNEAINDLEALVEDLDK
jgi:hypothetical protein